MRHHRASLVISLSLSLLFSTPAFSAENRVWQPTVANEQEWRNLAVNERDTEFSKFVLDVKTGKMYFVDAHVFKLHIDFGLEVLLKKPRTYDSVKSFNLNYGAYKPQFILGYLTHYPKLSLWTYSFWEGDAIRAADVLKTQKALQKTFFAPNLSFRPDSLAQETMAKQFKKGQVKVIHNDKIYQKLPFQAFQTGQAIGTLRIVPPKADLDSLNFSTNDIVLLQETYPDINPVAGIITTKFSTPLAHVNLRATAWGIPNAGYKNAASEFAALDGQIVHYSVTDSGINLRAANEQEINTFKTAVQTQKHVTLPAADLTFQKLNSLNNIRASDVIRYGTKTSNLGEIVHANAANVNVPTGFGIPFYYYTEHIKANNLQPKIDALLNDPRLANDAVWRREQLTALKQAIMDAPMKPEHIAAIFSTWQKQLGGKGVFVRSSTNAEDLKGFNGAGLYDTVPNVASKDALEPAIKKVWASIWNERAVSERQFAGIDHRQTFPAVLVQTGVNATAAGVLLTTDIWGHNPHTYTINAKWGLGIRVVEGQKIPEQILYDTSNYGTRIISRSNETSMLVFDPKNGVREVATPAGDTILTEARARKLGETVDNIVPLFSQATPLDIEWVLEGEKIWIVQARPYVTK